MRILKNSKKRIEAKVGAGERTGKSLLEAIKRLRIYFKEMYPIVPRLFLGVLVFGEIHFVVLLNHGVTEFQLGIQEIVCAFTVFSFLCWLRIADDYYILTVSLWQSGSFKNIKFRLPCPRP